MRHREQVVQRDTAEQDLRDEHCGLDQLRQVPFDGVVIVRSFQPLRWRAMWCATGVLVLSGCVPGQNSAVKPVITAPWGVSSSASDEGLLFGSQLWCSVTGEPVEVSRLSWEHANGLEVSDFRVVTQPASEDRIGLVTGTLSETLDAETTDGPVRSTCDDFVDVEHADPEEITYMVLELRLSDPEKAGAATGLTVHYEGGTAVEPVSVVICPKGVDPCTAESGPRDVPIP